MTLAEADWTALFVGGCFSAMDYFRHFAAYSMFYFAAASFSEMARRLDRGHLAQSFLARTNPNFAQGLQECARILTSHDRSDLSALESHVCRHIEPLNIAGLCDPAKRNWYPVNMEDVVLGAEKLGLSSKAVKQIISHAPWARGAGY